MFAETAAQAAMKTLPAKELEGCFAGNKEPQGFCAAHTIASRCPLCPKGEVQASGWGEKLRRERKMWNLWEEARPDSEADWVGVKEHVKSSHVVADKNDRSWVHTRQQHQKGSL